MSRTTYLVCAINMVASGIALFLLFRSPAKPKIETRPTQEISKPEEPPLASPEAGWLQFEQATGMQAAASCLAKMPANEASLEKIKTFIEAQNVDHTGGAVDFAVIGRLGAGLHFLGAHSQWNSACLPLLQSIAKDRQASIILRDIALRSVMNVAIRKHAATNADDNIWRTQLADFLIKSEFGTETSMGGLALLAAAFAQTHGITTIDKTELSARVRAVLENHSTVQETTLIAALEVCVFIPVANLADIVLTVVKKPRSEAVFQTAISTLGKIGNGSDISWLAEISPKSTNIYHVTEAAWFALQSKDLNNDQTTRGGP